MTKKRAYELRDSVLLKLSGYVAGHDYRKIYVMLGRDYLEVIHGIYDLFNIPIEFIKMEKIGKAQQKLRNLLFKISPQMAIS